uniref:Histone-lysine N-methyltransferase SETMAR n=1 Tax=Amphilophus citrinellus TaxID=61819 RepID=A0A3Q0T0Y3_AMPCI
DLLYLLSYSQLCKLPCTFKYSREAILLKLMKGVLFHQDNAPAHKSVVAMAAVYNCDFELVDHPPYSPDLASSDYFMLPNLKKNTRLGNRIGPIKDQDESFSTTGIRALQHRWKKCVDRRGDYVEK